MLQEIHTVPWDSHAGEVHTSFPKCDPDLSDFEQLGLSIMLRFSEWLTIMSRSVWVWFGPIGSGFSAFSPQRLGEEDDAYYCFTI